LLRKRHTDRWPGRRGEENLAFCVRASFERLKNRDLPAGNMGKYALPGAGRVRDKAVGEAEVREWR
jgi:hypothetical protein